MKHLISVITMTLMLIGLLPLQTNAQDDASPNISVENAQDLIQLERFGYGTRDAATWTNDQSMLAVGGSLGVWIFDGDDLEAEPRFVPHSPQHVHHLAFNHDGTQIAIGWGERDTHGFSVLDVATGDTILELAEIVVGDPGLQFSQDGSVLVIQTQQGILVWDMLTIQQTLELPASETVDLSPDGTWIAAIESRLGMAVYDAQTGEARTFSPQDFQEGGIRGPALGLSSLSFIEYEGKEVIATLHEERDHVDWLRVMRFWDIDTSEQIAHFYVGSGIAIDYEIETLSDDGIALASTIPWHRIRVFFQQRQWNDVIPQPLLEFNPSFMASNGQRLAVGMSYRSAVHIWNLEKGQRLYDLRGEGGVVHAVAISQDGHTLFAGVDEFLNIWQLPSEPNAEPTQTVVETSHRSIVTDLALSADEQELITASFRDTIRWDIASLDQPTEMVSISYELPVRYIASSDPNTALLVEVPNKTLSLINIDTNETMMTYVLPEDYVRHVVFSPDGTRLIGLMGTFEETVPRTIPATFLGQITSWDVQTGEFLGILNEEIADSEYFAVSPDGSLLAIAASHAENGAYLVDAATGDVLLEMDVTGIPFFSADGAKLYFVDTGVINVWGLPQTD